MKKFILLIAFACLLSCMPVEAKTKARARKAQTTKVVRKKKRFTLEEATYTLAKVLADNNDSIKKYSRKNYCVYCVHFSEVWDLSLIQEALDLGKEKHLLTQLTDWENAYGVEFLVSCNINFVGREINLLYCTDTNILRIEGIK